MFPNRILVYSLSCGKCTQELSDVSSGLKQAPDRFMLTAFTSKDRAVSMPLDACVIAGSDSELRRAGILDWLQ